MDENQTLRGKGVTTAGAVFVHEHLYEVGDQSIRIDADSFQGVPSQQADLFVLVVERRDEQGEDVNARADHRDWFGGP